jgi:sugar phosphate isomerase/epimerase
MTDINRREFFQTASARLAAAGILFAAPQVVRGAAPPARKMKISLSGGTIGVTGNQREMIDLAAKHGFEAVEANGAGLVSLTDEQLSELTSDMKSKGIVFAAASLPVEFRKDESGFATGMKSLPQLASALRRAGVTRMITYVMPCHDTLTYVANFKMHATRLHDVAAVLKDNGIRLGLEYVGPRTAWARRRYSFIRTMAETKDLIEEIGTGNVGFVLDTYHWWTAGDTEADLLSLRNEDIVSVDLNDGVAGVPRDEQLDLKRELPCRTGVIDIGTFVNAVNKTGYDGPVRAEPFNQELNGLDNDEACVATVLALKKAMSLIR